jgi:hypothetical protein
MRVYRMQQAQSARTRYFPDTRFTENDLAFYMGWLGHYIGDGSQPLHVTIHGDGWKGARSHLESGNRRSIGVDEADPRGTSGRSRNRCGTQGRNRRRSHRSLFRVLRLRCHPAGLTGCPAAQTERLAMTAILHCHPPPISLGCAGAESEVSVGLL